MVTEKGQVLLSHSLSVLIIPASIVYFYSVLAKSRLQVRSAINK